MRPPNSVDESRKGPFRLFMVEGISVPDLAQAKSQGRRCSMGTANSRLMSPSPSSEPFNDSEPVAPERLGRWRGWP